MNLTFCFTGQTVAVTGAGQGIGHAVARHFLAAGARVVAVDRDEELLHRAWSDAPGFVHLAAIDIVDAPAVQATVAAVADWSGGIDILVNNAGITRDAVVWKMTDADFRAVVDVHLGGTFNFTRAVVPAMRAAGFGRIVNVTSYTGLHGNVGQANYAAAKAGIIGMTKAVAKEVARFGITVNAISPNAATSMVAGVRPDKLAELTAAIPQGRFADPGEMAAAVAFLASREAGYITGTVLAVDGGMSM
jgi:3-oxoacyl-[acyl-carrier protein] reductase